jgi:predicted 3-demethylubiquinone-9 3-methyltransferase (glyoxalase superfamily)
MQNKIVPSLWFSAIPNDIEEILTYYKTIFGNAFVAGKITNLGDTPSGDTQFTEVSIFGQKYTFMRTENEHAHFNDALALTIYCEDQNEIDLFWNYFTKEGHEVQCGWCNDKYGLRWQVIPKNLGDLLNRPNGWNVMMEQTKIVIEDYLK